MILPKERDPRFVTIRRGGTLTDSDHQLLALWAAACAEHVLHLFEAVQPSDPRPRHAIEQTRAWARGEVKALWVQTTNPWVSLPNLLRFDRKPGDGKFLVVSDIYPTETTEVADLILPSAAWVEREGVFGNAT